MPHDEHIVDSDAHFKIDGKTRAVSNTQEIKTMVVQGDYKSERFTFELPKIIDGHDMSQTTTIQIHYINISSSTREQSVGVYEVDDVTTETSDDKDIIVFSWLLSGNVTKYVGNLSFAIRFVYFDSLGDISYAWNTVVYSSITVSATINNGEEVVEEYTDILQSWYTRLFGEGESYLSAFQAIDKSVKANASSAEESKNSASQSAEAAANSEKIATNAAKESLGIRTLYSAVRPDLNGNLDPSSDMVVGPSESVSFTSNRNRLSNVTVHGYTIQEGEGDASPDNVREIKNAGKFNKIAVIDGTNGFYIRTVENGLVVADVSGISDVTKNSKVVSTYLKAFSLEDETTKEGIRAFSSSSGFAVSIKQSKLTGTDESAVKAYFSARPLTVGHQSTENTGKFYTGIEVQQGDEYRCKIIELQAPLHKGDTLETNVQSEYDLEYIFDGTEDWASASSYQSSFKLLLKTGGYVPGIQASNNYQQRTSGTIYANDGCYVNADTIFITDSSVKSVSDFKALLASKKTVNNPVRLFCKSVSGGTLKNIKREKYVKSTHTFTGNETINLSQDQYPRFIISLDKNAQALWNIKLLSSHFPIAEVKNDTDTQGLGVFGDSAYLRWTGIDTVEQLKELFSQQVSEGTPVTIEYELAKPEVYADEPIIVEHPSGTTTVNSESSSNVSVGFKPFQDGGDAETISGHTWQDILSAIDEAVKASSQTET